MTTRTDDRRPDYLAVTLLQRVPGHERRHDLRLPPDTVAFRAYATTLIDGKPSCTRSGPFHLGPGVQAGRDFVSYDDRRGPRGARVELTLDGVDVFDGHEWRPQNRMRDVNAARAARRQLGGANSDNHALHYLPPGRREENPGAVNGGEARW